jgi:hypothetical protein
MKPLWIFLMVTAWAQATWAQTPASDKTGSVTGMVRDSVTRMPIRKASVSINPMMVPMNSTGKPQMPKLTSTDASGTFTITDLPAGQYRLIIQHQNYPQARFGGITKNIEIKAGESAGPVAVDLIPGGAVSGRILDEDGEPIQGCFAQVHPVKNPDQGVQMSGNPSTNENGDYRFYSVPPGKYVVMAQCMTQVFQPRPFSAGPDPPPSRAYPVQYYPMSTDAKSAEAIELLPGAEKSGIDFKMRPAAVTQIHGVFSPSGADWKGHNVNMNLLPVESGRRNGANFGAGVNQEKGTFEFRQVFPGSYMLVAFSQDSDDKRIGVAQRIEIGDRPVDVMLELKHAFEITGKIELDPSSNTNQNQNQSGSPYVNGPAVGRAVIGQFGGISVSGPNGNRNVNVPVMNDGKPSLSMFGIQLFSQNQVGMPFPQAQASDDGSFTLKGVIPGTWRIQANGPMAFVKSAWLGSTDVTNVPVDLSSGAAGALRIVVSMNTATLRGSAPAGQMIFAQKLDEDMPFRSSRSSGVDQSGQYTLPGLAPGKYRVTLTDVGGPPPDEGGQEITVKEGETVMLDLKPQPAQQ